jgi:hypothetical protein
VDSGFESGERLMGGETVTGLDFATALFKGSVEPLELFGFGLETGQRLLGHAVDVILARLAGGTGDILKPLLEVFVKRYWWHTLYLAFVIVQV